MSKRKNIISTFRNLCIEFVGGLCELFPDDNSLFLIKTALSSLEILEISDEKLVKNFSNNMLQYKDIIKKKDSVFFLNNPNIFKGIDVLKGIDETKIFHFRELWTSDKIDDDDKEQIWKFMNRFVEVAEDYKKTE
jgi:hypothetical protein